MVIVGGKQPFQDITSDKETNEGIILPSLPLAPFEYK